MNKDYVAQLYRIYNALGRISTKGEETLIMSDCLRALAEILQAMSLTQEEEKE